MSGKHTAALSQPAPWNHVPWHVEESADAVRDANGYLVCCVAGSDVARPIAAAPELFAALREIETWLTNGDYDTRGGLIEMERLASVARSALRKASGEG